MRASAAFGTWALFFVASPGIVTRDGLWFVALVALVPWALACSRPGRFAFLIEWLAAAVGISAICYWSTYVIWITLIAVALVPAVYMACAGVLLRRLARVFPLAVAVPCSWIALETLRSVVEPPFGFGWLRLGHHAHAQAWLAGSARVWGTAGVGFALAAVAGGIADILRARARPGLVSALALAPLALALVLSFATRAPATEPGPRVLLVQPAFEQERKMSPLTGQEMLREILALTRSGIREAERAGEALDVVAWGECVLPYPLGAPDLLAAYDAGARAVPWGAHALERNDIESMHAAEDGIVRDVLLGLHGKPALLPPGVAFVSGVEHFVVEDGALRRQNAILSWNSKGERTGLGGKVHLVPGAEHLAGFERLAWVRDTAFELAGYVPDFVDFDGTRVLVLEGRAGRRWRAGATVCFDNMFEDPYAEPLRAGDLDFHLIASNEAWYHESWEYDQMIAFSRMIAIETGRSVVRATNAGISCVIDPDGRDVARLEVAGRDRMVPGSLRAVVPVPVRTGGADAPRPSYPATRRAWNWVWIGLGLLLAALGTRRPVTARI